MGSEAAVNESSVLERITNLDKETGKAAVKENESGNF